MLLEMGTQDLGTGTRTIMTQVAAETLGLQMSQVKLVIGDNICRRAEDRADPRRSAACPHLPARPL